MAEASSILPVDVDPLTGVLRVRANGKTRREFLAGGGVGLVGLGAAGVAALLGMSSPGPNSQSFKDAYVQKNPTANQTVKGDFSLRLLSADETFSNTLNPGSGLTLDWTDETGVQNILELRRGPSLQSTFLYVFTPAYDASFDDLNIQLNPVFGSGRSSRISFVPASESGTLGQIVFGTASFPCLVSLGGSNPGTGAQVGLTTSAGGSSTGQKLCLDGHRHAFSGRFSKSGHIRDASLGGATPAKFARIISAAAWTLRRISVYALTAPVTGSDTYGVVNAAGTLQGTAVSLASGVKENATALQVTNLTGGTVYYIAVTARATTPALDVNVEVEYTMNI